MSGGRDQKVGGSDGNNQISLKVGGKVVIMLERRNDMTLVMTVHIDDPRAIVNGTGKDADKYKQYLEELATLLKKSVESRQRVVLDNGDIVVRMGSDKLDLYKKVDGEERFMFSHPFKEDEIAKVADLIGVYGVNKMMVVTTEE